MKQIIIGVLVFLVWLGISAYWYVCVIKDMCHKNDGDALEFVYDEPSWHAVSPELYPQESQVFILPTIYFIFEVSTVKNVDDMINASNLAREYLEENPSKMLYITGHTCSDTNSVDENYKMGMDRAISVKSYMVSRGVPQDRIIVVSKGDREPIASNYTKEGKMLNRRVEMVVR